MTSVRVARLALCVLALAAAACGKKATPETHSTTGVVRNISHEGHALTVAHDDFPGFMEAMVMTFDVPDAGLTQGLKPGDKISFTIAKVDDQWPVTRIAKVP
ncbi:MAG: copper-binding protein [Elusimicrobia bacterium]|nr:copper-binding protein [Elusimicrobiota bacterium]